MSTKSTKTTTYLTVNTKKTKNKTTVYHLKISGPYVQFILNSVVKV